MSREKKQSDWDELQELTQASMNHDNDFHATDDAGETKPKASKSSRASARKTSDKNEKSSSSRKKTVKSARSSYDTRDISLALERTPNFESLNDEKMASVVAAATLSSLEASANAQAAQAQEAEEKPKRRRRASAPATEKDSVISGIVTQITQAPMRRKSRAKAKEKLQTQDETEATAPNTSEEKVDVVATSDADVAELHYEPTPFVELHAPEEEVAVDLLSAKLEEVAGEESVDAAPLTTEPDATQSPAAEETSSDDFWGDIESLDVSWGRALNAPTAVEEESHALAEAPVEAQALAQEDAHNANETDVEINDVVEEAQVESSEQETHACSDWDDFWQIDDSLDIPWGRRPETAKATVEPEEVVVEEVCDLAQESVVQECVEPLEVLEEPVEETAQDDPEDFWKLDDSLEISWGRKVAPDDDAQEKAPTQKRNSKKSPIEEPKRAAQEKRVDDVESFFDRPQDEEELGFASFDEADSDVKSASKKTKPEKKRRRARKDDQQDADEFDAVGADVQPVKAEKVDAHERARKKAEEFVQPSEAVQTDEEQAARVERKRERKERRRDDSEPVETTPSDSQTQERPVKRDASEIVLPSWEVAVSYVVRANIIRHNMSLEGKRK
ncbi:MAG: hypothetical protein Q4G03_07930 [Planctomycetia bacterium]|nr:hypothetical protein [Planctomycetia bacterium]